MKKHFIILGLGLLLGCSFVSAATYYDYTPYSPYRSTINHYNYPNYYRYNTYNPYNNFNYNRCYRCNSYNPYYAVRTVNPYYYRPYFDNMNYSNVSKLKQRQRLQKLKRKLKNQISWFNNKNNGSLTGYSLPVNKNILNNDPYQHIRPMTPSPTCNTDLWNSGNGTGGKHSGINSRGSLNDNRQTGATSGVTIIYD